MIPIQDTLVSDDVLEVQFVCNLSACHGNCCVEGDEGAPLEEDEIGIIEDYMDQIEPFMMPEGLEVVKKYGVFDYGMDGGYVTPLINDGACAFVYYEGETVLCAIEKAHREGLIDFPKPISCHLYPIRITTYDDYEAVNYHKWPICSSALKHGKTLGVAVYQMLKEPLIRKYGEAWYAALEQAAKSRENL
jgi:hypothetical protein